MTWQSVGTHSFVPTDKAVQVGSFDLTAGQDTIWVRVTQLNPVDDWPWSYGILSWRNASGTPLGSIKAYSNRLGEVFRLGNGLSPSDGVGSLWFEPRGFNLGWLKAGFPWELQFEAQAGANEMNGGYWNRENSGGILSPKTLTDRIYTDGDIYVGGTTSDPEIILRAGGGSNFSGTIVSEVLAGSGIRNLNAGVSGQITTATSDARLKEEISPLSDCSAKISRLNPVSFKWRDRSYAGDSTYLGFLAQEMQVVFPEVTYENSDGHKCINYPDLIAPVIGCLQEALQRIEQLESQISSQADS